MPEQRQDDTARRFGPPPGVTLYVPVVVAFLVQVPATVAVSLWMHVAPRWVLLGTVLAAASALALLAARALPGPTVAAVAAFTVADLFVPPDAGPPFIALAFAIVGAVVRGALGWALGAVGSAWLVAVVASGMSGHLWHPFRIALTTLLIGLCFAIGVGLAHPPGSRGAPPRPDRRAAARERAGGAHPHRPRACTTCWRIR
ncbi:hypothetical protein [Microbacterium elymi]|uniref:Uncharacterized protein n=1 Tax=Microbacterium elymi TaxID=2909587 RepID=A0ABY5NJ62_9MICO|nr:hypothetical protein [Microbacterium elymi]UUT35217.1 hypothetical protein L2X98_33930 [Microbacterium elymi]